MTLLLNKSDIKCWHTLGCPDQYKCRGLRLWHIGTIKGSLYINMCRGWRPWNNQDYEAVEVVIVLMYLLLWLSIYPGGQPWQNVIDLEGQGQSLPKTIEILTEICTSGPNLVVLAWTGDELSCRQAHVWDTNRDTDTHTHGHRHTDSDNTMPEGQNWPRVRSQGL